MRFSSTITIVFIAFALAWVPLTTTAEEVYRWVDENGVVHFGARAPEQGDSEKVSIQVDPGAATSQAAEPNSPYAEQEANPQPSVAQQRRDARAAMLQENTERAEITSGMCTQARDVIAQLEPSPRVNVTHEDGTVTRMDDNDRLEKLGEAKAFVAENCNK
jgi:hypothetical protein